MNWKEIILEIIYQDTESGDLSAVERLLDNLGEDTLESMYRDLL